MQNTVAKILKIYAVINALAGVFLGFYIAQELIPEFCFVFAGACIVASFGIYAFGEVVQLLQDIKDGTNTPLIPSKFMHQLSAPTIISYQKSKFMR